MRMLKWCSENKRSKIDDLRVLHVLTMRGDTNPVSNPEPMLLFHGENARARWHRNSNKSRFGIGSHSLNTIKLYRTSAAACSSLCLRLGLG